MAIEVTRIFIRCSFSNPDSVTSRIQSPDSSVYDQQDALLQKLFTKKRYLRNAFLHSFVLSWYFIFGLGFSADDKSSHWLAAPPLHKNELHHYNSKYQKEEWTDKVSRPHCLKLGCSTTYNAAASNHYCGEKNRTDWEYCNISWPKLGFS